MRKYWLLLILLLISIVHAYADDALSDSLRSTIKQDDVFVRLILSELEVHKKKAVTLTYRLYTKIEILGISNTEYPKLKGFKVKEIELPQSRQLEFERYNNMNYYTLKLRQIELTPKQSGKITILPVTFEVLLDMPTGQMNPSYSLFSIPMKIEVKYEFASPALELDVLSKEK